eukprot:2355591-Pyramimonas_sp.AAC.1
MNGARVQSGATVKLVDASAVIVVCVVPVNIVVPVSMFLLKLVRVKLCAEDVVLLLLDMLLSVVLLNVVALSVALDAEDVAV